MDRITELESDIGIIEHEIQSVEEQITAKDLELEEKAHISSSSDMERLPKDLDYMHEKERQLREEKRQLREEEARREHRAQ